MKRFSLQEFVKKITPTNGIRMVFNLHQDQLRLVGSYLDDTNYTARLTNTEQFTLVLLILEAEGL